MSLSSFDMRVVVAGVLVLLYGAMCVALWLRARDRQQRARLEVDKLTVARTGALPWLVAYASQTGYAQELAQETARLLHSAGAPVQLLPLNQVDAALLAGTKRALFIASTCGDGDAPDQAALFRQQCMHIGAALPTPGVDLTALRFGLLALGDRRYAQFCAFGRQLGDWLQAQGAQPLFERVDMDNADPVALQTWQHRLMQVNAMNALPAWQASEFEEWTLSERHHLNPGSAGAPVFHLVLAPPALKAATAAGQGAAHWESGDLVQVCTPHAPEQLRTYSVASIARDGCIHLAVRQALRADGTLGVVSGWLTADAALGAPVALRLRAHGPFRLEANAQRPLLLIGNGTGLAALRSHLRARAATNAGPNWLVFGERNAAHDFFYQAELQAWRASGVLQRLDLAFSRDQAERVYVQHRLAEAADMLRAWVRDGAAIYVCGSLHGMAQGVDDALRAVLGPTQLAQLRRTGRYRRDVY